MKRIMKFCLCFQKSLNFEIHFLSFPWEIFFGVISGSSVLMYLALRKCKNDCKIFKITLVQIFVH